MWFEILPSALIIYVAFEASTVLTYAIHKYFFGNVYRRDLRFEYARRTYLRDRRLMNNPYKYNGLNEHIYCPCIDGAKEEEENDEEHK